MRFGRDDTTNEEKAVMVATFLLAIGILFTIIGVIELGSIFFKWVSDFQE